MPQLIIGVHAGKKSLVLPSAKPRKTLTAAIDEDLSVYGLNAVQIFTHGPRNNNRNKFEAKNIEKVCSDVDLSVHGSYLLPGVWKYKFAKDDSKLTDAEQKKNNQIIGIMKSHLKACEEVGAWGLVLHVTKQPPKHVAAVVRVFKPLARKFGIKIVLEMVASKADAKTYETPKKINYVSKLIGKGSWWGWCVDTAHLWGAGVDIQSYDNMKQWLSELDDPDKIVMFHLNGSENARGSGKDKHWPCLAPGDKIWEDIDPEKSGVKAVIEFCVKRDLTMICEIKRGSKKIITESINTIKEIGRRYEV